MKIKLNYCFAVIILLFGCQNSNVVNVKISGTVCDKETKKSLKNFKLFFFNDFYADGDYYSATPTEIDSTWTDSNGYYSIFFERSTFVTIDTILSSPSSSIISLEIRKKNNVVNLEL